MAAEVKDERFWYKSKGITKTGDPITWEGGFSCRGVGCALNVVKIMSCKWNASEIEYIGIYAVDEHGVTEEQPTLWQTYPTSSHCKKQLALPHLPAQKEPVEEEHSALAFYEQFHAPALPDRFSTVNHKETET
jgi:hypothetical protein